jgi:hypothetical protein
VSAPTGVPKILEEANPRAVLPPRAGENGPRDVQTGRGDKAQEPR